jgi:chaperonin GroEL
VASLISATVEGGAAIAETFTAIHRRRGLAAEIVVSAGTAPATVARDLPGFSLPVAVAAPAMGTAPDLMVNPLVVVDAGQWAGGGPAFEAAATTGRPLLVLAGGATPDAAARVVEHHSGGRRGVLVAVPAGPPDVVAALNDAAVLTGCEPNGLSLGRAELAVLSSGRLTVVGGRAQEGALLSHTDHVRDHGHLSADRAARLSGVVTLVEVGQQDPVGLDAWRRAQVLTGVALSHGVVPGGGLALFRAAHALEPVAGSDWAAAALAAAARTPLEFIVGNAGYEVTGLAASLGQVATTIGLNVLTGQWADMAMAGIVDAAAVVTNAVVVATDLVATLLDEAP